MELSKLLNNYEDDAPQPRAAEFRRLPSLTSTFPPSLTNHHSHYQPQEEQHQQQRSDSLSSLTPLKSALPPLVRSGSDCSDSTNSPVTPPQGTPAFPFETDHQRHRPADLKRPPFHHGQSYGSRTSSFGPPSSMDQFAVHDFLVGMNSPPFPHPQLPNLQPAPGTGQMQQIPLPQIPQISPVPSATSLDQTSYTPSSSSRSAPKTSTKKNSYPCPVAKQYNCSEHFTTSGHAARHAKKHTGKKDAICPECKKAFTRKDNMEQHRRTHSNNRAGASKSSSAEESRQRKVMRLQQQQQKKAQDVQQAINVTTPANPEIPQQSMSAALIPPHPAAVPMDPLQMAMLDPQLRNSDGKAMLGDMTNVNIANAAFWEAQQQMPMPFMQNPGTSTFESKATLPRPRPLLQRSSYRDDLQNQLQSAPNFGTSPSASPVSSSGSLQSPSRLDTLAFAASTQKP